MPSFGLGADRIHTGLIVKQLTAGRADRRGHSLADLTLAGAPPLSTRRRPKRRIGKIESAPYYDPAGPVAVTSA
jgi:hypothetical protein